MTGSVQMSEDPFDWLMGPDGDFDPCTSHVLLYQGYDLAAAGIWEREIAPCLLCAGPPATDDPALCVTDEVLHWGRRIHFVCCGDCGTRGPWADRESEALQQWNVAHQRHIKDHAARAAERTEP